MRRGEVWVGRPRSARASAEAPCPVLILQDDALIDAGVNPVLVAPLHRPARPDLDPLRLMVPARDRLRAASQVAVDELDRLDREQLVAGPLTRLTADEMKRVERSLRAILGMYP